VTGLLCLVPFIFVLYTVNKRIPLSFFLNIFLYTVAILSKAVSELLFHNDFTNKTRLVLTSVCVALIELSLAYFIFQI
jgi:hypothetical protein